MAKKIIKKIKISLAVLFILLILMPMVSSNEILGIDISVSQNPIPCGGSTTVTATIKRAPLSRGRLPLGGIAKLWDYDTGLRDGDDLLDQEHEILWFEENTVTFTLRCDSKEGGCDLYGPSGESGESGTEIYVSFYDFESAKIYVKCEQIEVDGEIGIHGLDDVIVGNETSVTISAERLIENVTNAQFDVSYDSSVFEVLSVGIIHPELLVKMAEGFFSYNISSPDVISFTLSENILPIILDGPIVNINLLAKNDSPIIWDTTNLRIKQDSIFYNELGDKINVCLGGNHSIFIAPNDATQPLINSDLISFSQGKIVGSAGSVTDDLDIYENYLTLSLYNESNVLVAEDFVNEDGSFQLDNFFWLGSNSTSNLIVNNGVNLSMSYSFIPSSTSIPYVLQNYDTYSRNNTGEPCETVKLEFDVLGNSDTTETYDFMVSDTQGWFIEQSTFEMALEPMENKTITINVTIPTTAENKTTNEISLKMTSRTYQENSDSDSVIISVFGTYEKPTPSEKTPGFELTLAIIVIALFALLSKRKKKH